MGVGSARAQNLTQKCESEYSMASERLKFARLALLAAYITVFFIMVIPLLAGLMTPGYSHVSQFISELGASGAQTEVFVRFVGFLPAGLSLLVFGVAAYLAAPKSLFASVGFIGLAIYSSGYLVAVVYPCDAGCRPDNPSIAQEIHNIVGLLGYILAPVLLLTLSAAASKWPGSRKLSATLKGAAALALLGLLTLSPESPWVGISQRLIEAAVLISMMLTAKYLVGQNATHL